MNETFTKSQVSRVVSSLIVSGKEDLDQDKLNLIKSFCKGNPTAGVEFVYSKIAKLLVKPHSQIRFACIQLANVLFHRSAHFRKLLLHDHHLWLSSCLAPLNVLPPPTDWARRLMELFVKSANEWFEKYKGVLNEVVAFHTQVHAIAPSFTVPGGEPSVPDNIPSSLTSHESRISAFRHQKYTALVTDWDTESKDVHATLQEAEGVLNLLVPDMHSGDTASSSNLHLPSMTSLSSLKAVGIPTSSYRLEINLTANTSSSGPGRIIPVSRTDENSILFDTLEESISLLKKQYLPWTNKCLKLISIVNDTDRTRQATFLKKVIDIKQRILNFCEKGGELLGDSSQQVETDEEDEEFEDVEPLFDIQDDREKQDISAIETKNKDDNAEERRQEDISRDPQLSSQHTEGPAYEILHFKDPSIDDISETEVKQLIEKEADPERRQLLEEAPIVPYGDDLYFWDKTDVTFSEISAHAGIEYHHRFLGERQDDNVVSKETLENLRKRPVLLRAKRPDIQPCRAPLPSGKLCSRRDLVRCPFHGPIIPRDDFGVPLMDPPLVRTRSSSSSATTKQASKRITSSSTTDRETPAWLAIESEVMAAHNLTDPRHRNRVGHESNLVPLPSETVKNPRQQRLLKRVSQLSKASGVNVDTEEMNTRLRDKQTYRW